MPSDSMSIGVSGIDAYQAQIDAISNNIANVGTTAYKGQSLNFQDLLYQTQQAASAPTTTSGGVNQQQIGIGVKVGSTDTDMTQGGVQTTGVNTNMMINGDGYFILDNADGTGAATYTRNGDFSLNANGLLYDPSSGKGVMGYMSSAATGASAGTGSPIAGTGSPGPIVIPIGLKSLATATGAANAVKTGPTGDVVYDMSYGGNLDSTQYAAAAASPSAVAAANTAAAAATAAALPGATAASTAAAAAAAAAATAATFSTPATAGATIYDSLGNAHLVNISFTADPDSTMPIQVNSASGVPATAATAWTYTLSSTDGTLFAGGTTTSAPQYAFFDQNGKFINTSGSGATPVHLAGANPSAAAGDQLAVTQWGTPIGANNSTAVVAPAPAGPIGIDLSGMTALSAAASATATSQNGYAPGTLSNIAVGQDGTITGSFSNGQTQKLARVAVAAFQNVQGLTRLGGSDYAPSTTSGEPLLGTANTGRFGAIQSDALEMSNVSIADQFTKLITAQNAFTANSKSITTANENLQTVIGLIH